MTACRPALLATALACTALLPAWRPAVPPAQASQAAVHRLPATPETVAWGYYDARTKPVLVSQTLRVSP